MQRYSCYNIDSIVATLFLTPHVLQRLSRCPVLNATCTIDWRMNTHSTHAACLLRFYCCWWSCGGSNVRQLVVNDDVRLNSFEFELKSFILYFDIRLKSNRSQDCKWHITKIYAPKNHFFCLLTSFESIFCFTHGTDPGNVIDYFV